MTDRKYYLKSLFKNGRILLSLFFAACLITTIIASYELGIISDMSNYQAPTMLILSSVALFAIFILFYCVKNLRLDSVNIADCAYLALILLGITFLFFFAFDFQILKTHSLFIASTALIIGSIFFILRLMLFGKAKNKAKTKSTIKVKRYYNEIIEKFSLPILLVLSAVCISLFHLICQPQIISLIKHKKYMIICSVLCLPIIVYAIKSAFSRKITLFDGLAFSLIITFPVVLSMLFVFSYSPLRISVWAVAFGLFLIYLMFRYKFYKGDYISTLKQRHGYIKELFSKYDCFSIASIGSALALFILLMVSYGLLEKLSFSINYTLKNNPIPVIFFAVVVIFTLLTFILVAIFGCKKKGLSIVDFFLANFLSTVVFSFILLFVLLNDILVYCLSACLLLSITLLIIRANSYKK